MKWYLIFVITFTVLSFNVYSQKKSGGTLSYCEEKAPRTFDPITAQDDFANVRMTTMIYDGLFELNIDREVVKKLTESYYFSPDRKQITVVLKKNIKWSDGGVVSAKDVFATYQAIKRSQNQYLKRMISIFQDATVEDPYKISFSLVKQLPEDVVLRKLLFKILPEYKITNAINSQSEISKKPVGTGYYKFSRRGPTDIQLTRNQNCNAEEGPYIDQINAYVMNDVGTQIENLVNKYVDLLIEVPPTEIARLQALGFDVFPYNSLSFSFIGFNFKNPLLKIKEVRQAMTYGYNRKNVLEKVYQSQGEVISGPFPRTSSYFFSDIEPFPYDKFQAIKLLEKAGFNKKNADGYRYNSGGTVLKFNLIVPRDKKGDDYLPRVINQFVSDMKTIGVKITIEDLEFENFLERLKVDQRFDLAYSTLVFDDAGIAFPLFHSSNCNPGQENFISYKNDEVDKILEQQRDSEDENVKINSGKKLHKLLRDDCPYLFLWSLNYNAAVNPRVRKVRYTLTPFTFFGHVNEWYIKE